MNQKQIIRIALIAVSIFLVGAVGYYIGKYSQPFSRDSMSTWQGVIICFPSRGTGTTDNQDCDMGLRGDDGKYYELENLDVVVLGGKGNLAGGQWVKVSGILVSLSAKYDSDGVIYVSRIQTITETTIPCTLEAKICPDGSSVGRTGPNCEFAACPGESQPPVKYDPNGLIEKQ